MAIKTTVIHTHISTKKLRETESQLSSNPINQERYRHWRTKENGTIFTENNKSKRLAYK